MSNVLLYRTTPKRMRAEEFSKIAGTLGVDQKPVETDEALAAHDSTKALVYAQPGAKLGGVLFYTDQSKSMGEVPEQVTDARRAKGWSDEFLNGFGLIPERTKDEQIDFHFETTGYANDAVTFDGKERRKRKSKTEIASRITLNGIAVTGPRANVRMAFQDREIPIMIHCGLWERIEVYEERELVREHDVARAVKDKLAERNKCCCKDANRINDIKLAYLAAEYTGGPDVLAPYYFIEVEFEDRRAKELGVEQGPRQAFWLPAYR